MLCVNITDVLLPDSRLSRPSEPIPLIWARTLKDVSSVSGADLLLRGGASDLLVFAEEGGTRITVEDVIMKLPDKSEEDMLYYYR